MGFERLATIAAGLNRWNFHAETVDGNNPLAVIDAIRRKKAIIAAGEGPVLLDILTYRQSGHSPSDASSYRTREEIEAWKAVDALQEFRGQLLAAKAADAAQLEAVGAQAGEKMHMACRLAVDLTVSPRLGRADGIARVMFSTRSRGPAAGRPRRRRAEAARRRTAASSRSPRSAASGVDPTTGERLSESKAVSFRDALFEAVIHHAYHDDRLIIYGEENRDWDGAFAVYRGLTESLPYHRLFNAPISEGAIVGTAVGYAMEGGRPLVELMYCDFMGRAGDEIFNQLSKWQAMSAGRAQDARRAPGQRGQQVRRPALAGLERHDGPHPGAQGGLPRHPVRRQGPHACRALPAAIRSSSSRANDSTGSRSGSRRRCRPSTTRCPSACPR